MSDKTPRKSTRQSRKSTKALRTFSPAVAEALTSAITAYDPQSQAADEALRLAIVEAVAEARAQSWRVEDLLASVRAATPESGDATERAALRDLLKRRAMIAFFG